MRMLKQEESEKIERYTKGQSDNAERAYLESLFQNGENNTDLRHHLEKEWNLMLRDPSPGQVDLNHLLDRVHHIIRKNETLKRQKPLQKLIRIYIRAAAILLLPLLIAGGLLYNYWGNHRQTIAERKVSTTIYAPLGSRVSFNLPDGSSGMLNSGSRLSYSLPFNNDRRVSLEGEAWFEVYHDELYPLEITSGTSKVKVLGTKFNISAYPADSYIEVVLKEGKVEYLNNELSIADWLAPSERLICKNGKISRSVTDPAKYYGWTEGKLIFRGDPMTEVALRIERWYNVKIYLADKELEKYSFRAIFLDDTLEEVLRCLSMTSPIRYKITPRKLLADGTYEKVKVSIYIKK
jgi:transmembrane sensor